MEDMEGFSRTLLYQRKHSRLFMAQKTMDYVAIMEQRELNNPFRLSSRMRYIAWLKGDNQENFISRLPVLDYRRSCLCGSDELQKALLGEWRNWAALNQFPSEPIDEANGCNNPVEWVSKLARLLRPNETYGVSEFWYVLEKLSIRKL